MTAEELRYVPPVDLDFLPERARAYVVGLEARNKVLRLELQRVRADIANGTEASKARAEGYREGYAACAVTMLDRTSDVERATTHLSRLLHDIRNAAHRAYTSRPDVPEQPAAQPTDIPEEDE